MKSAKDVFEDGYQDYINKSLSDYEKDGKQTILSPKWETIKKAVIVTK